jgi:hypothetical protein
LTNVDFQQLGHTILGFQILVADDTDHIAPAAHFRQRSKENGLSWLECDSPRSILSAGFSENPRFFVRGIEVCTSSVEKNFERVKGIRVTGAKVWQARERVDELRRTDDRTRPNCPPDSWHRPAFCNTGFVAQGLNMYSNEEGALTGIGLHCRKVIFKPRKSYSPRSTRRNTKKNNA